MRIQSSADKQGRLRLVAEYPALVNSKPADSLLSSADLSQRKGPQAALSPAVQLGKNTTAGFLLQRSLSGLQVGFTGLQGVNFGKRIL